jgi:hypothetical protein
VETHAGKDWTKGVALGKTLKLRKGVKGAVRLVEKTLVGRAVHEIKVGEEGIKLFVVFEELPNSLTRDFIEEIAEVKEEKSTCRVVTSLEWLLDVMVIVAGGEVSKVVNTSWDGHTKLSLGGQKRSKLMGVGCGNDGASNASVCGTDSDWAKGCKVVRVFVEGKETVCCEVRCHGRRDVIGKKKGDNVGEGVKVGSSGRVGVRSRRGFKQSIGFEDVSIVRVGAKGSTPFEASEGLAEDYAGDGDGWVRRKVLLGSGGRGVDAWREEALAEHFDVRGDFGGREGRLDALVCRTVVVIVCKGLCSRARVSSRGEDCGAGIWLWGDISHLEIELGDATSAKEGDAVEDGSIRIWGILISDGVKEEGI